MLIPTDHITYSRLIKTDFIRLYNKFKICQLRPNYKIDITEIEKRVSVSKMYVVNKLRWLE